VPEERDGWPGLRVLLVPDDGGESRSFHLSGRALRALAGSAVVLAVLFAGMAGSWWYLAARASRADELQARVAVLEGQQGRIEALARELRGVEARYERLRGLFGSDSSRVASDLWLPPVSSPRARRSDGSGRPATLPTSWPLTERGFITQPLVEGASGEHAGVDIAVAADSYIRAAGAGTVAEVGEDPVFGRFIRVDHQDGYRSLYAHASLVLVGQGDPVRRNEVLGLTGSTGRSTAPHLHFEILREEEPVDPLTMVSQP